MNRRHLDFSSLMPVRSLLLLLLTDKDAAKLLRVSHDVATSLLPGYAFTQHIFRPATVPAMWRLKALYEAYDMRPTRISCPRERKGWRWRRALEVSAPFVADYPDDGVSLHRSRQRYAYLHRFDLLHSLAL